MPHPPGSPTSQFHNHNAVSIAGIRRTTLEFMGNNVKRWPIFGRHIFVRTISVLKLLSMSFLSFLMVVLFLQDHSTSKKELRRLGLGCFHRISICWLWGYVKVITVTHTSNIALHFCCWCVPYPSPSHRIKWLNDKSGLSSWPSLHDFSILWTEQNLVGWVVYRGIYYPFI